MLADPHVLATTRGAGLDVTVHSLITAFIERAPNRDRSAPKSPVTLQRYRGLLRNNLQPISNECVEMLDTDAVKRHYELLAESLSPTTVFHVDTLLRAACAWGKRRGLITNDPFVEHPIDRPSRSKKKARSLLVDDVQAFVRNIGASQRGNAALFALATGMRRGEVAGLRLSSIDLKRRVVIVRESRYEIVGLRAQKGPKTEGSEREIPLSPLALGALERERCRLQAQAKLVKELWEEHDYAFRDELGRPISPGSLSASFRVIAQAAGVRGYTFHGLRHTFATWILTNGKTDWRTVQHLLGHSDARTTLGIYGHVVEAVSIDAVDTIGRMLGTSNGRSGRRAAKNAASEGTATKRKNAQTTKKRRS